MRQMLVWSLALISFGARAATMETRLADVQKGTGIERVMVLADTEGRVLWVDPRDEVLVKALVLAHRAKALVGIDYDLETGVIAGAKLLADQNLPAVSGARRQKRVDYYRPTVFGSLAQAQAAFNSMDNQTRDDSQCYNRAHGWAYDLWRTRNVYSLKIFIFYTQRYIREYSYKWWFHVAPMVWVYDGQRTSEMVIDRSFSQMPLFVNVWTNTFMQNGARCPVVERYSQYRNYQEDAYCYLMRAYMYYSTPRDLEHLESRGREELDWNYAELRAGRRQAFIHWERYDP